MTAALRFARPDDAGTIHRLICELAAYEKQPDAVRVTPAQLREQLQRERPPFECLLAERTVASGPIVAGMAMFFHNYSSWRGCAGIYLEDLFVSPEHRGHGIGSKLLGALARLTTERGGARLEWSVLDWNVSAIRFYESLGAYPMSGWNTYRLTDAPLADLAARAPAVAARPS